VLLLLLLPAIAPPGLPAVTTSPARPLAFHLFSLPTREQPPAAGLSPNLFSTCCRLVPP
jgi:hypothetical protein